MKNYEKVKEDDRIDYLEKEIERLKRKEFVSEKLTLDNQEEIKKLETLLKEIRYKNFQNGILAFLLVFGTIFILYIFGIIQLEPENS